MSTRVLASLAIAACAASWGGIGIVVRELDMPSLAIACFQELQGALVAAAIALALRRPGALRPPPLAVTALGLVLALHFVCLFGAVRATSVASAVLVTYSAPIMIALLAPALLRERVSRVTAAALAVSATGVAAIALAGGGDRAVSADGIGLALLAAVTYALYVVLLKRLTADVNPITVAMWQAGAAALALSPAALAGGYTIGTRELGYLVLLGAGIVGVTGVVYILALRAVPATTAGILGYLEPLSAVVLAAIVLDESPGPATVIGGAAIVAAGVAVVLEQARGEAVAPVAPMPPAQGPTAVRRS